MAIRNSCFVIADRSADALLRWDDLHQEIIIMQGSIMTVIRILGLPTSYLMLPTVYDAKDWDDMGYGTKIYDCTGEAVAVYSRVEGLRVKVGRRLIKFPLPHESDFRTFSGTF